MSKKRYLPEEMVGKLREAGALLVQGGTVGGAWATGEPLREFLYVDDLADALVFLLRQYSAEGHVKVCTGEEVSVRELAEITTEADGLSGRFVFNTKQPEGTLRKLSDISRISALGPRASIALRPGVASARRRLLDNFAGRNVDWAPAPVPAFS